MGERAAPLPSSSTKEPFVTDCAPPHMQSEHLGTAPLLLESFEGSRYELGESSHLQESVCTTANEKSQQQAWIATSGEAASFAVTGSAGVLCHVDIQQPIPQNINSPTHVIDEPSGSPRADFGLERSGSEILSSLEGGLTHSAIEEAEEGASYGGGEHASSVADGLFQRSCGNGLTAVDKVVGLSPPELVNPRQQPDISTGPEPLFSAEPLLGADIRRASKENELMGAIPAANGTTWGVGERGEDGVHAAFTAKLRGNDDGFLVDSGHRLETVEVLVADSQGNKEECLVDLSHRLEDDAGNVASSSLGVSGMKKISTKVYPLADEGVLLEIDEVMEGEKQMRHLAISPSSMSSNAVVTSHHADGPRFPPSSEAMTAHLSRCPPSASGSLELDDDASIRGEEDDQLSSLSSGSYKSKKSPKYFSSGTTTTPAPSNPPRRVGRAAGLAVPPRIFIIPSVPPSIPPSLRPDSDPLSPIGPKGVLIKGKLNEDKSKTSTKANSKLARLATLTPTSTASTLRPSQVARSQTLPTNTVVEAAGASTSAGTPTESRRWGLLSWMQLHSQPQHGPKVKETEESTSAHATHALSAHDFVPENGRASHAPSAQDLVTNNSHAARAVSAHGSITDNSRVTSALRAHESIPDNHQAQQNRSASPGELRGSAMSSPSWHNSKSDWGSSPQSATSSGPLPAVVRTTSLPPHVEGEEENEAELAYQSLMQWADDSGPTRENPKGSEWIADKRGRRAATLGSSSHEATRNRSFRSGGVVSHESSPNRRYGNGELVSREAMRNRSLGNGGSVSHEAARYRSFGNGGEARSMMTAEGSQEGSRSYGEGERRAMGAREVARAGGGEGGRSPNKGNFKDPQTYSHSFGDPQTYSPLRRGKGWIGTREAARATEGGGGGGSSQIDAKGGTRMGGSATAVEQDGRSSDSKSEDPQAYYRLQSRGEEDTTGGAGAGGAGRGGRGGGGGGGAGGGQTSQTGLRNKGSGTASVDVTASEAPIGARATKSTAAGQTAAAGAATAAGTQSPSPASAAAAVSIPTAATASLLRVDTMESTQSTDDDHDAHPSTSYSSSALGSPSPNLPLSGSSISLLRSPTGISISARLWGSRNAGDGFISSSPAITELLATLRQGKGVTLRPAGGAGYFTAQLRSQKEWLLLLSVNAKASDAAASFVLVRNKDKLGFRSVLAGGKMLKASKKEGLTFSQQSAGEAEMWRVAQPREAQQTGFVIINCKHPEILFATILECRSPSSAPSREFGAT
eukprot:TRINITY_DN5119_c0_g1_i1.p1 TRINITY_DN5119_c0_g1~~TRINITY_DN5119_c0_g1_i1.p1  ORF type:complete len:1264 (-),score=233.36 TRINITY_DN5119_c0_g1_i1:937-4704(-)